MDKNEIRKLITKKEQEIRQLMELSEWIGKKHVEQQIDLRLEDLHKLYKELNQ